MTVTDTVIDSGNENVDEQVEAVTETDAPGIVEEVLVEEISIDGMCGVY